MSETTVSPEAPTASGSAVRMAAADMGAHSASVAALERPEEFPIKMYRLVFKSAYDLSARRRKDLRIHGAIWYPDKASALAAAQALRAFGQELLIQQIGGPAEPCPL